MGISIYRFYRNNRNYSYRFDDISQQASPCAPPSINLNDIDAKNQFQHEDNISKNGKCKVLCYAPIISNRIYAR
ncbi:hypothetical protein ACO0LD_19010 [Undibacterium sp. Ji83W]|uniref:hypothetical protein n=1 Tax=Undibacterium sp. Ji83W TaxID=3413043 RepID=UPI003BF3D732